MKLLLLSKGGTVLAGAPPLTPARGAECGGTLHP